MNATTIYKNAVKSLKAIAPELFDRIMQNPEKWETEFATMQDYMHDTYPLVSIICACRADFAKSATKPGAMPAIKRIIKNGSARRGFTPAWTENGKTYVIDGYRLVCLNNELPSVSASDDHPDAERILESARENPVAMDVPSITELKNRLESWKADGKVKTSEYCRTALVSADGAMTVYASTEFLYDMLCILPDATITAKNQLDILYFSAENGTGAMCPVKP